MESLLLMVKMIKDKQGRKYFLVLHLNEDIRDVKDPVWQHFKGIERIRKCKVLEETPADMSAAATFSLLRIKPAASAVIQSVLLYFRKSDSQHGSRR